MTTKLIQFIAFFVAFALVLKNVLQVLVGNLMSTHDYSHFQIEKSIGYGGIALCIVSLTIFLKRDIWAYLFFLVIVTSFSPLLAFTNIELSISIGSLKLDLIAIPLLIVHVLLNVHLIRVPKLSKVQETESINERVEYFTKVFKKKTDDELLRIDENELVPEAIEARKILIAKRSL